MNAQPWLNTVATKMISASHNKSNDNNNKQWKIDDWRRNTKMEDAETEAEAKMISTSHIKSCDNNKHWKIDDWRRQIKMEDAETEAEAKNDFNKSQQKL